jgi:hypothetical protein
MEFYKQSKEPHGSQKVGNLSSSWAAISFSRWGFCTLSNELTHYILHMNQVWTKARLQAWHILTVFPGQPMVLVRLHMNKKWLVGYNFVCCWRATEVCWSEKLFVAFWAFQVIVTFNFHISCNSCVFKKLSDHVWTVLMLFAFICFNITC